LGLGLFEALAPPQDFPNHPQDGWVFRFSIRFDLAKNRFRYVFQRPADRGWPFQNYCGSFSTAPKAGGLLG
jgi:hypothetical protein